MKGEEKPYIDGTWWFFMSQGHFAVWCGFTSRPLGSIGHYSVICRW